jgi:hypothetical protein
MLMIFSSVQAWQILIKIAVVPAFFMQPLLGRSGYAKAMLDFLWFVSLHQGKEMNNQPIMQCETSLQCFSALIIRIQWFIYH